MLVFNGNATDLVVDLQWRQSASSWAQETQSKQIGDTCVRKADRRCERGSGVAIGKQLGKLAAYAM